MCILHDCTSLPQAKGQHHNDILLCLIYTSVGTHTAVPNATITGGGSKRFTEQLCSVHVDMMRQEDCSAAQLLAVCSAYSLGRACVVL